ncbi:dynamin family protein [Actinospica robiniae]|uniref:dynamin family protein n=1 Tax=Actinospica robiniae TaxID=304901 RepID=UPI000412DBEF|nr:dynamin family protein [Actinospica robiniae]
MPDALGQDPLKTFKGMRLELAALIGRLRSVADELESAELRNAAAALEQRVNEDVFRVMVLGEFNCGKSTLVNALLGERVLPAFARPCTAVICEVGYGQERRAVLYPRDGSPSFELPIEELAEHITIDDEEAETLQNRYKLAEITWPLPLCADGVQLTDSPGTNEDSIREAVTNGYLARADAVVYVVSALAPFGKSERTYLENHVLPLGHSDIFFLVTRIDQAPAEERADVIEVVRKRVGRVGEELQGRDGTRLYPVVGSLLFPVDGKGALEGRLAQDAEMVQRSGLAEFEESLRGFLTSKKGRVKLAGPSSDLRTRLWKARALVHDREALYDQDLAGIVTRYDAQKIRLDLLDDKRAVILGKLENDIRSLERTAEDAFRRRLAELAEKCPAWAEEAETQGRIESVFKAKSQGEALAAELTTILTDRLRAELLRWQSGELLPMLTGQLGPVEQELAAAVADFLEVVQQVRAAITGGEAGPAVEFAETLAETGSAFGDALPSQAGRTAAMSLSAIVLTQLGVLVAAALLSFTPLGLFTAMFGAGAMQRAFHVDRINSQVRRQVGEAYAAQIRELLPDAARTAGVGVGDRLRAWARTTGEGLAAQTATVREQVEATIEDKKAGEARVAGQRERMRRLLAEVDAIEFERGGLAERINRS